MKHSSYKSGHGTCILIFYKNIRFKAQIIEVLLYNKSKQTKNLKSRESQ